MLTRSEFISKLEEARASQLVIDSVLNEIYQGYNFEEVDFKAVNGINLDEAIQCYVHYGELPISGNLEDFWISYKEFVKNQ